MKMIYVSDELHADLLATVKAEGLKSFEVLITKEHKQYKQGTAMQSPTSIFQSPFGDALPSSTFISQRKTSGDEKAVPCHETK